jgi:hypothetical protein
MRATECGKEAWSINGEPMDKNRIEGVTEQGERAHIREALVIKAKWRRFGGCAVKECVLTPTLTRQNKYMRNHMALLRHCYGKLKLKVNGSKSAVASVV